MSYVDEVLEKIKKRDADQPEFIQAVTEVLDSLRPVIDKDEQKYQRLVAVRWLSKAKFSSYDVQLVVVAMDRNGLLIDVLDKINEEKINIVKLNTVVDGPEARIFVTINVSGREQLDRTCDRILRVKDVVDVIRN